MAKAKDQLSRIVSSWTSSAWQEIDFSRIKDMNIRQLLEARSKAAHDAQEGEDCIVCPDLAKHVSEMVDPICLALILILLSMRPCTMSGLSKRTSVNCVL